MGAWDVRLLSFCSASVLIGATLIWAADAHAQQTPTPSASSSPPASTAGAPVAATPSAQAAFDKAPKQVIIFDPCKIANPPAYCNAK
ncbi:MAG TPA: hypothetical protein VMR17_16715 [Xanthobacteraceae bacterium]|jgi:hypothetical protein|nr:hypothetical protein [Xanthobacteraceae bacterium]